MLEILYVNESYSGVLVNDCTLDNLFLFVDYCGVEKSHKVDVPRKKHSIGVW